MIKTFYNLDEGLAKTSLDKSPCNSGFSIGKAEIAK
jgi:hypothetical protein